MPSIVRIDPNLSFARTTGDDELYVMSRLSNHIRDCRNCGNPLDLLAKGQNLCARGTTHAIILGRYIYNKGGKAYSLVDRERGKTMQIEIPPDCKEIRDLMLALERGLVISSQMPTAVVHNGGEPTRPRLPVQHPDAPSTAIIEVVEPGSVRIPRRRERTSRYRGSLYLGDMSERLELQRFHNPRRWSTVQEYIR